jgi:CheY-like chemotaxis protein
MSQTIASRGARILLVEPDEAARLALARIASRAGYAVEAVPNGEGVVTLLTSYSGHYDLVITEFKLGAVDGIQLLKRVRTLAEPPEVVVLTGSGTLQSAVEALRAGPSTTCSSPATRRSCCAASLAPWSGAPPRAPSPPRCGPWPGACAAHPGRGSPPSCSAATSALPRPKWPSASASASSSAT